MTKNKIASCPIKVVVIAAISADGRIAESEDQLTLTWTSKDDTKFFIQKTRELGAVVMGRKTFETIGKPLEGRLTVVMTRSPQSRSYLQQDGKLEFRDMPPAAIIEDLASRGYNSVAVVGGAMIYSQFFCDGLVDEIFLTIEPVLFGRGLLLAEGFDKTTLRLLEVSKLGKQSILAHYSIVRDHLTVA